MAHPEAATVSAQVPTGQGNGPTGTYAVALRPDRVDSVLSQALAVLPLARSQPGNHGLDIHQNLSDPTRIMMFERWDSEADLGRWLADDRLKTHFARLTPLFAEPPAAAHWALRSPGPPAAARGETPALPPTPRT